ncbi:hypothetical protein TKK_0013199 [Trichogramma kaykai]|uniref:Uncharacterized protein n=2 Tax=Trichogramma kaykai TaxID=54128 RepID=A0ABD2WKK3_9HYME
MTTSTLDIWPIVKAMNKNLPEAEKHQLLSHLHTMIDNWNQQSSGRERVPSWRGEFTNENIDCLLKEVVKDDKMKVIDFLIANEYEDEPDLDQHRKPILRRRTAVHVAANLKLMPQVYRLFEIYNKFHVNYEDDNGLTHFHAACMCGRLDVVKEFLNFQDPNSRPQGHTYPDPVLSLAVRHKRIKVIELLLKKGAEPNLANVEGWTPLHFICQDYDNDMGTLGRFFKICELRGKPVNVNAQTESGWTPLHVSMEHGNVALVEFLLDKGANPNAADLNGTTPLHVVCCKEYEEPDLLQRFFNWCEENGRMVDVNAVNVEGKTPLQWCKEHGHSRMAQLLRRKFAV